MLNILSMRRAQGGSTNEHEPFLEYHEEHRSEQKSAYRNPVCFRIQSTINVILTIMCAISWIAFYRSTVSCEHSIGPPFSPASHLVREKTTHYNDRWEDSAYVGPPSSAQDLAWDALIKQTTIRLSEQEISELDDTPMSSGDGGYLVGLGVYHELHCLRKIQHFMHESHHLTNTSEEDFSRVVSHNYHCLELLRQSIVCRGDLTPFTYEMRPVGFALKSSGWHRCVDLEAIDGWMESHALGGH